MQIIHIEPSALESLDRRLLDDDGRIRLYPASHYADIPHDHLRAWCVTRARYQIPTVELVEWLKRFIGDRSAIEVGSGNGDLYHHVGIPGSDNYCQLLPDVQLYYALQRQATTRPPNDVVEADAIKAIDTFKPDIVIAAWLTQKAYEHEPVGDGNMYGPEETEIIQRCQYVHIGNHLVHGTKRIHRFPHAILSIDGLVSRARDQEKNCIYIWEKQR